MLLLLRHANTHLSPALEGFTKKGVKVLQQIACPPNLPLPRYPPDDLVLLLGCQPSMQLLHRDPSTAYEPLLLQQPLRAPDLSHTRQEHQHVPTSCC